MGGKALLQKGINTVRLPKDEYFKLYEEIKPKLESLFEKYNLIPAYRNKESFGDMDILWYNYKDDGHGLSLKDKIILLFNSKAIVCNGNVYSVEYKNFQIDLINTKLKYYNSSLEFYSWNDVGNLIGRIIHKLGFKYGFRGLTYVYRSDNNYILKEIDISDDIDKILKYCGFDADVYKKGFDSLEDIFQFVIKSEYYSSDIFAYENLNHENRVRNKKRDTYRRFLEYIKENNYYRTYNFSAKEYYYKLAEEYFGNNLLEQIKELREKDIFIKYVRSKFNGDLVMQLTGLKGEELGKFIRDYKNLYPDFDNFIYNTSQEIINNTILNYYEGNVGT